MELELGLALPDPGGPKKATSGELGVGFDVKKRTRGGFGEAIIGAGKATLPLFVSGSDEDGERRGGGDDCERTNKRKRLLVGWPPVKCAHHRHRRGSGSGYVKVKMEGVPIGRKLDVSLHGSYSDLRRTLDRMFPPEDDDNGAGRRAGAGGDQLGSYVVTYEDGEGDWLLVGDVPWEVFVKSVKRLKILA